MNAANNEIYIGDGLYASWDGFGYTLRAPRTEGDHYVYLEPHVLKEFQDYIASTVASREKAKAHEEKS
jgi:hypothetical protein